MLIVISPAKTLDFETPPKVPAFTMPDFLDDSAELIDELRANSSRYQLSDLMGISPKLADLNSNRYHNWSLPFTADNAKQSVLAFKGDVYSGLDADNLDSRVICSSPRITCAYSPACMAS